MTFQDCFPIWDRLDADQQARILGNLAFRSVRKGTILHNGNADCTGLLLVKSGQLRAYILSDEGREITIYRLFDRDLCLLSASCIMRKSMDKRLAAFLLEEAAIEGTSALKITHETIANHLGSHREVVTRMLRYFQSEGMVRLSRGMVQLLDEEKLRRLQDDRP